jgi:hypothetical protein
MILIINGVLGNITIRMVTVKQNLPTGQQIVTDLISEDIKMAETTTVEPRVLDKYRTPTPYGKSQMSFSSLEAVPGEVERFLQPTSDQTQMTHAAPPPPKAPLLYRAGQAMYRADTNYDANVALAKDQFSRSYDNVAQPVAHAYNTAVGQWKAGRQGEALPQASRLKTPTGTSAVAIPIAAAPIASSPITAASAMPERSYYNPAMPYVTSNPYTGPGGQPVLSDANVDVGALRQRAGLPPTSQVQATDPYGKALNEIQKIRDNAYANPTTSLAELYLQSRDPQKRQAGQAMLAAQNERLNARLAPLQRRAEALAPELAPEKQHKAWINRNVVSNYDAQKAQEAKEKVIGDAITAIGLKPASSEARQLAGYMQDIAQDKNLDFRTMDRAQMRDLLQMATKYRLAALHPELVGDGALPENIQQRENSWFNFFSKPYELFNKAPNGEEIVVQSGDLPPLPPYLTQYPNR